MNQPARRPVYLDHAATTPMLPEAAEAMVRLLRGTGNASALHTSGRAARRVVEEARETVAGVLGARPGEVTFTSGGTESDNLAVKGIYWSRRREDPRRTRVLATAVEHPAVLDALGWLEREQGADVTLLPVDAVGRVDLDALEEALGRDPGSVALVSVMWANNEVGTVQPVEAVVRAARAHGIPVHTDAVQAVGSLPVDFAASGVDALSLTGHKLGGPLGAGALVTRRDVAPTPLIHGGGQEHDMRSGTVDVPAVAGLAVAVELATRQQPAYAAHVAALRDRLVNAVTAAVPGVRVNGDPVAGPAHRLPGHAHLSFPGCEGDLLLMLLDQRGIECSTGSACSAGVPAASHVLLAMGRDEAAARGSLRVTFGARSTQADVDAFVEAVAPAVERARAAGLSTGFGADLTATVDAGPGRR